MGLSNKRYDSTLTYKVELQNHSILNHIKPGHYLNNSSASELIPDLEASVADRKRPIARLVFDSRANFWAPAAGLRGGPTPLNDYSYQLLYILDDGRMEVELQLTYRSKTHPYSLTGQLMGATGKDRRAYLISRGGGPTLEAKIDDTFTFKFQNLAQGEYRLNVMCDRELIEIVLLSL